VLALGLGGFPLTGGALAKLALKGQFGDGLVGTLATVSAAGSTLLMIHFLRRLVQTAPPDAGAASSAGYTWPWLTVAFTAVAVPWALYPTIDGGSLAQALAPATLWAAFWPVLVGGVAAVALWQWGHRLPSVPEGDLIVAGEAAMRATGRWGEAIERADGYLRQWPVASLSLLTLVVILAAVMLAWG